MHSRGPRSPGRGTAVGVALAVWLASCGSTNEDAPAEPEVPRIPAITDPAHVRLPLDAYQLSESEYQAVQRVAWRLADDCVSRFGPHAIPPELIVAPNAAFPAIPAEHHRRYGLLDAASAARYGYQPSPDIAPPDSEVTLSTEPGRSGDTDAAADDAPTPTVERLLYGDRSGEPPVDARGDRLPPDGCQGEAVRTLSGGAPEPTDQRLRDTLSWQAFQRAELDSRVVRAVGAWRDCMAAAGYEYGSVWEPNDADWPRPPEPEEIAIASADVACKLSTNLVGVWYAVEVAYQARLIDEHAAELAVLTGYQRALVDGAAESAPTE